MPPKNRFSHGKKPKRGAGAPARLREELPPIPLRKAPVEYGKPFILLEDEQKQTFQFNKGAWAPYEQSIAECRQDCLVKELPQKVNRMTRYEIRRPIGSEDLT